MNSVWRDALRVARLVAADPHGCGGVVLRAGAGPVRDRWLDALRACLGDAPWRRMPGAIADDRLIGGLDLAATLATGRRVAQIGFLAEADGGVVVAPMAERMPAALAAHLAAALDAGAIRMERDGFSQTRPARFGVILLDEGIGLDEQPPPALTERLAFHVDLTDVAFRDTNGEDALALNQEVLPVALAMGEDAIVALCKTSAALGIASLRGPLLAARTARLAARLDGRDAVEETDVEEAARLVLAPRATRLPVAEPPPDVASPDENAAGEGDEATAEPAHADTSPEARPSDTRSDDEQVGGGPSLDERIVEAARAAIPAGLLAMLTADRARLRAPKAGRVGASAVSTRSGRSIGVKRGDPRQGRIDLIETLRAAAPWQRMRRSSAVAGGERPRLVIRPDDIRITRFKNRTETTTIFAVDASGSAALERLAEAKGAVELLLAQAYARRDKVALVAFRGQAAALILPPTRSLVRAKRGLAGLPGGGGTPLAAGIEMVTGLALQVRRGGGAPIVVMLTDGRANIARSGAPGRGPAGADSLAAARLFRETGVRAILIDTAARPQDSARGLAAAMGAGYLPLPYADAGAMSAAIRSAAE